MDFCYITPTSGLELFATRSKTHLVLPQVKDETYRQFYKQRREAGDTLILDNGAYEGVLSSAEELFDAALFYQPQTLILPDAILQIGENTLRLVLNFLHNYASSLPASTKFLAVPSSLPYDISDWWHCCRELLNIPRINGIGLPRNLFTHYGRHSDVRAIIAEVIHDIRPECIIHALGMAEGNTVELSYLVKSGLINSCDSSAPVWRGWNGYELDSTTWVKKGTPVNFSAPLSSHRFTIEKNIGDIERICNPQP
jgi:hypothetical protein